MNLTKIFEDLSSRELKSAMLAMAIGDANLRVKSDCVNALLQVSHSPKVRDYVGTKRLILSQVPGIRCYVGDYLQKNRKLGKVYPTVRLSTNSHQNVTKIWKRVYRPKKSVSEGVLNSLTPLGLAIWYMDDGHLSIHHNVKRYVTDDVRFPAERSISSRPITFNTHKFSYAENCLIAEWLMTKWGVQSRVKPDRKRNLFFVYANTENARKFVDIVRPYVLAVPSMHYKIDFKYSRSSELLKFNVDYWTKKEGHECAAPLVGGNIV